MCLNHILSTIVCRLKLYLSFLLDIHFKFCLLLGHINKAIGKFDAATLNYQRAKELSANVESKNDRKVLAFIYEQLCVYARGDNSGPISNLTPLLKESFLSNITRIVLHQALGNIYRSAADWHNSTTHFKIAVQIAKSNGHINRAMECKAELGRAYRSSGCHTKALKRQKKLLEYAQGRSDVANIANACGYIGFTYYSMGKQQYNEAVKYLYCKLELSKSELDDISGYRWCLNNIGKIYLGLQEYNLCIQLFIESSEIAKQLGNTLGLGTAYGNLGSACRAVGKHSDAVNYHQLYLEIAQRNSDTGGVAIMQRELILDHLYLYEQETNTDKRTSFLAEAGVYAFKALKTSLEVRSRLSKEDDILKIANFEFNQAKIYALLLFIVIEQGQYEAGLVLSELGRAHALADRIKDKFEVDSSFFADVLAIIGSNDVVVPSALSAVLRKIGKLISGFDSHILVYSIVENPLPKDELQKNFLYIWHVSNISNDKDCELQVHFKQSLLTLNMNDFLVDDYISSKIHELQISVEQLSATQAQPNQINKSPPTLQVSRDISRKKKPAPVTVDKFEELYNILINPMCQFLFGCNYHQGVRLIIVPHGFLFSVPFCALKTQGNFLIEKFVICLSPSLYILDIGFQREKEWSKLSSSKDEIRVLAVGNPKMPKDELEQLPGAEKEVKCINSLLKNTKLLCGKDATKKTVLESFSEYSVIHLATHATAQASLDDALTTVKAFDIGDYSVKGVVALARSDSQCSGELTSSDIEKLSLEPSCELVVLSCCESGCGKITGDGILGLSRSLMCAGVMNMLVTRWKIPDTSTSLLMEYFYKHYMVNRDAPAALQFSMLQLIENQHSMEEWTPFCCFGMRYVNTSSERT